MDFPLGIELLGHDVQRLAGRALAGILSGNVVLAEIDVFSRSGLFPIGHDLRHQPGRGNAHSERIVHPHVVHGHIVHKLFGFYICRRAQPVLAHAEIFGMILAVKFPVFHECMPV